MQYIISQHLLLTMLMCMGVYQIAVTMLMSMHVGMFMGVLQRNRIFHHQHRGRHHNQKPCIKPYPRSLSQKQDAEKHT